MQGRPSPWIKITCQRCGTVFLRRLAQVLRGRTKFCSRACSNAAVGPNANHWKGGSTLSQSGYRQIRVGGRYRFEHRLVAASILGRPLEAHERVHHRNGDKLDNRPENLEITTQSEHMRSHQRDPEWTRNVRAAARRSSPAKSEALRRRWADPEKRAAMIAAIRRGKGLMPAPDDH